MFYSTNFFFRRYTIEDIPLLLALYENWNWENIDAIFVENHLKNLIFKQYEAHNAGVYAIFSKENEQYMGHCGVKFQEEEWHLSFRFLKSFWKNDAPVEVIKACIDYDFKRLKMNEIVIDLDFKSKAAGKMIMKAGFKHRLFFGENEERYSVFVK
jgi:[ribosomal protein S5]-alanine N-acetyltransferase